LTNRKPNTHQQHDFPLVNKRSLIINAVFALVLGFLGPFGSFNFPLFERLIYWFVLFNLGYIIYFYAYKLSDWVFKNKQPPILLSYIFPSIVSTVPISILVVIASSYFSNHSLFSPKYLLLVMPNVFILGVIIDATMKLVHKHHEPVGIEDIPGENFINRLPKNIGQNLICISMEDHYLLAYTDLGNHMMLMRMKDAMIELKEYPGFQVHRSYWIASEHVSHSIKNLRKNILVMSNDMEIPVSRKYLALVKEAKLLSL
jgi:hypothetical protein